MQLPDKIYVLGGSGSGKSSLAKKISQRKHIPYFDLDDIMWNKKYTDKLPVEQRVPKLHTLLETHRKWVIEWCFVDWANECYLEANLVIILNVSKYTVAWRILKRYFLNLCRGDFTETFGWVMALVKRAMSYQDPKRTYSLRRHIEDCKKYECNYVVIHDAQEILG